LHWQIHRGLFNKTQTRHLTIASGDKDHLNVILATPQLLLQVGTEHARHRDIKDQASDLVYAIGRVRSTPH
jgi:hypothetical protein